MSDCSRSAVFLLSGSVLLSWQHYGMLSALHSFRRLKAISSASTVGCFRCYINLFRRLKALQCLLFRAPFENQFPVWMVMLVDCMSLFMVGVDRWFSAFLYSLTWSTNISSFRLYHPRLVSFCCFWEVDFVRGISFAHVRSQRKKLAQTGM